MNPSKSNDAIVWRNCSLVILSTVFFAALIPSSESATKGTRQTAPWRNYSRTARLAIDRHEFELATKNYEQALKVLSEEEIKSDIGVDLKLNLSEGLRRRGKYSEALNILASTEPTLGLAAHYDPLVVARFWRRRASILVSMKDYKGAADCYRKAFNVCKQFFPRGSKHYTYDWTRMYENAVQVPVRCDDMMAMLRELRLSSYSNELLKTVAASYYSEGVGRVLHFAITEARQKDFDTSAKHLEELAPLTKQYEAMANAWFCWTSWSIQAARYESVKRAARSIEQLLPGAQAAGDLPAEIEMRLTLVLVNDCTGQPERSKREWLMAYKVLERARASKSVNRELLNQAVEQFLGHQYQLISNTPVKDIWVLREFVNWSQLYTGAEKRPDILKYHCLSRSLLGEFLLRKDEPLQAEQVISTISPLALKVLSASDKRDLQTRQNEIRKRLKK